MEEKKTPQPTAAPKATVATQNATVDAKKKKGVSLPVIPLFLVIMVTLTAGYCGENVSPRFPTAELLITKQDGSRLSVKTEVARTEAQRQEGFMQRVDVPSGTGMVFVFDRDQILSFWMKNTPTPLSIAYIDSQGVIREIYDLTPLSLSPVRSTQSVRYALEVPQGWFSLVGILPGDRVSLDTL
jgi:uncharacterized membrane protein (UPF0127 family)